MILFVILFGQLMLIVVFVVQFFGMCIVVGLFGVLFVLFIVGFNGYVIEIVMIDVCGVFVIGYDEGIWLIVFYEVIQVVVMVFVFWCLVIFFLCCFMFFVIGGFVLLVLFCLFVLNFESLLVLCIL